LARIDATVSGTADPPERRLVPRREVPGSLSAIDPSLTWCRCARILCAFV